MTFVTLLPYNLTKQHKHNIFSFYFEVFKGEMINRFIYKKNKCVFSLYSFYYHSSVDVSPSPQSGRPYLAGWNISRLGRSSTAPWWGAARPACTTTIPALCPASTPAQLSSTTRQRPGGGGGPGNREVASRNTSGYVSRYVVENYSSSHYLGFASASYNRVVSPDGVGEQREQRRVPGRLQPRRPRPRTVINCIPPSKYISCTC